MSFSVGEPDAVAAPAITSFTADTSTLATTGMCTLKWTAPGASSLSISPNVGTVTGGSISVSPLANTNYVLTATNDAGSATASVNVTFTTPALTLGTAPVVKIRRDDHVATVERLRHAEPGALERELMRREPGMGDLYAKALASLYRTAADGAFSAMMRAEPGFPAAVRWKSA